MKRDQPFQFKFMVAIAGALASCVCSQAQIVLPPDSNPLPSVSIQATDPYALEGTSSGAFTLIRTGPTTNDLAVNLIITGTASNGVDYAQISNSITISNGFLAADILVNPIVDLVKRGNKTVVLAVDTNSAYAAKSWQKATVTIVDDTFNIEPPTVTLLSPTNGNTFGTATPILFEADASALGDNVRYVSFLLGDSVLGRCTNSPYTLTWTNPVPGKFIAFAIAVDQVGDYTVAGPNHFTVTNDAPSVKLTSPANGANFTVNTDISMVANASATAQTVAFLADGHTLGIVTNPAPFTFTWTNASVGWHVLRATATDSTGEKGYSNPVVITVSKH